MPAVSVVIPAWNLWDMTRDCLESLARHTPAGAIEVIVVDNGSSDATRTELEACGSALFGEHFQTVRLERNMGFAIGCNSGARAAKSDLLFFLNNDTLATPNWLPPLLQGLQAGAGLGMAGPLLLFPETGRVQHCAVAFAPTLEVQHLYFHFPGDHPAPNTQRQVQALSGAALLLDKNLFFRCGGFHEGYINGFEDLDLCCTLRKMGLRLACVPQSVVIHLTSQTPGRNDHDSANSRLINARHPGGFAPDLHKLAMADGFLPALSPALDVYLRLPDEREAALTASFTRGFDAERCARRLLSEPLWMRGYDLLAEHLESGGEWTQAAEWRLQQARQFPLPQVAKGLALAAARAGMEQVAQAAARQTQEMLTKASGKAALTRQATALMNWGRNNDDAVIAELYSDWLAAGAFHA
ncbi:MAG: glycosyltransferase family 2 protein [Deltaproteobacteria bacterium]|jgi:GT2 family glycosyltransferase|nr:glycosyltransferase family 2 protein [Deltaproteobacteria bacterium]